MPALLLTLPFPSHHPLRPPSSPDMFSIPTLVSLFLLAVPKAVYASPCVTFDINFNLLAFGFNGKDWNAGLQDSWPTGECRPEIRISLLFFLVSFTAYAPALRFIFYLSAFVAGSLATSYSTFIPFPLQPAEPVAILSTTHGKSWPLWGPELSSPV